MTPGHRRPDRCEALRRSETPTRHQERGRQLAAVNPEWGTALHPATTVYYLAGAQNDDVQLLAPSH